MPELTDFGVFDSGVTFSLPDKPTNDNLQDLWNLAEDVYPRLCELFPELKTSKRKVKAHTDGQYLYVFWEEKASEKASEKERLRDLKGFVNRGFDYYRVRKTRFYRASLTQLQNLGHDMRQLATFVLLQNPTSTASLPIIGVKKREDTAVISTPITGAEKRITKITAVSASS